MDWCLKFVEYWWKERRRACVEYAVTNNAATGRGDFVRAFRLAGGLGHSVCHNAGRGRSGRYCWKGFTLLLEGEDPVVGVGVGVAAKEEEFKAD